MTYPEALTYVGQARRFGMKLGLETMRALAEALGEPQARLRFIHLAGTNGKGSTAAFCESCLRATGARTGLYTSPHLVSVRERIQVNREPISEVDFAEGMTLVRGTLERQLEPEATFFELMTALALWFFEREKVDWVVWETGLGGRLDATNIVRPKVCIITNIGLDHQQYLGETLREIATEKAGIIKPGVPIVSAVDSEEAASVIQDHAKSRGSPLTLVHRDIKVEDRGLPGSKHLARIDGRDFSLGLIGPHQVLNAACAVVAMRQLNIPDEPIVSGLANTVWSGRFEILSEKPLVVLDGAHNPAGVKMLIDTWRVFLATRFGRSAEAPPERTRLVFASVTDKDVTEMTQLLLPLAREVSLVRLANERSAEPAALVKYFPGIPFTCYDSVSEMWQDMTTSHESITLITGSLFLVGEVLARRQGNTEEYRLNERLEKFQPIR